MAFVLSLQSTVKLGNKERFDKEQIGIKEPFPVTNLPFTKAWVANVCAKCVRADIFELVTHHTRATTHFAHFSIKKIDFPDFATK